MVRAIVLGLATALATTGASVVMGHEAAVMALITGVLLVLGVGVRDWRKSPQRLRFHWPVQLGVRDDPRAGGSVSMGADPDPVAMIREWGWTHGAWVRRSVVPGLEFNILVADEPPRSISITRTLGAENIAIGTIIAPETETDREAFRSIPPIVKYRLINNLRLILAQRGLAWKGLEEPVERVEIYFAVRAAQFSPDVLDRAVARVAAAARLTQELIVKAHLDAFDVLRQQMAEIGGKSDLPPFEVVTANEPQFARLRLYNLGTPDRFHIEAVRVSAPASFDDRYAMPWRELSDRLNKQQDGWRLIADAGDGTVNVAQLLTAADMHREDGYDVDRLLDLGGRPVEVVRIFSVPHPKGWLDVELPLGAAIEFAVEAAGEHTKTLRRNYRLTVSDGAVQFVLTTPPSEPHRSAGPP